MADVSPRTDYSTDGSTEDKNSQSYTWLLWSSSIPAAVYYTPLGHRNMEPRSE